MKKYFANIFAAAAIAVLAQGCTATDGKPGAEGKDGVACDITDNKDGSRTIECQDGTAVNVKDGTNGSDGDNGTACKVEDNGDGSKTIACTDGTSVVVADGEDNIKMNTQLSRYDELPGVVVTIESVSGGVGGKFVAGNTVSVRFRVETGAGDPIPLGQMNSGGIMLSGPTTNYQRIIARQTDLLTRSNDNGDGSYTYTFATAIPSTYLAPLNDTASFGTDSGELAGQALASGTYTIGIDAYKTYTVDGVSLRDVDNATKDVLFGTASTLAPREVVATDNCNQCHSQLQAHGGARRDVKLCVLCHTSGAEDKNVGSVAGGTPGVTIDFGVMVHSIHNAAHLPSVLGVTTGTSGARYYTDTGTPLKYVGYGDKAYDMSGISFPVMPSAYVAYLLSSDGATYTGTGGNGPMPRDVGYSALTASAKLKDDKVRTGLVACATCHGDPDGAGPLLAPAQGDRHKTAPSRKACGSCHTDVDWTKQYTTNTQTMFPQPNDAECAICHRDTGGLSPIKERHTHPVNNTALNPGLNIKILSVGSGNFAAGQSIPMSFAVTNDAGTNVSLHNITRIQFMMVGPTENPQVVAPAVQPFDSAFRKSASFTGNGTASKPALSGGAVAQTIGVIFSSATAFSVTGSTTAKTDYTLGASSGDYLDVTYAGLTFRVTQGSAAFAAGDRFYFDAWPTANSYDMNLPVDIAHELLGYSAGASAVTLPVGNIPLYWGRQTVWERTAVGTTTNLIKAAAVFDRLIVADNAVAALVLNDKVVIDAGLATEEYAQVGRIQTASDYIPFIDLATDDRIYFTTALRYAHAAGGTIAKATLTSKREGVHYTVADAANGEIVLHEGAFGTQRPVVVSYRTDARFGWKRSASDSLQDVFQPAAADSPEVGQEAGDWVGLQLLEGTYTLGAWAHKDFSVTVAGGLSGTVRAWDDISVDDTTYRTITPAATAKVLYGGATIIKNRSIISSPSNCETCHDKVQAHGNGRMGLETCLMCHASPGIEDGPKYSFSTWYTPASPGVAMEFRSLIHKVHMGKELAKKDEFEMVGVFLAKPYTVTLEDKGFPGMPDGAKNCVQCHGANNPAWEAPAVRSHPQQSVPVRTWTVSCGSCHDSDAAGAHFKAQTSNGQESCEVCHGPGREVNVKVSHKIR